MTSDWETVKRLAADFQKIQLESGLDRLSERHCIEIVTLLVEKHLLEILFTNDGKEYITPEHLKKEIQDELYVNSGRINLVEISKLLNVDLNKIEPIAVKIVHESSGRIHFILGQLIDEKYINNVAEDINEKLYQRGQISINDLSEQLDLPSEFIQKNIVEKYLGKIIKGRRDPANPRIIFTQAYLQRCKAKIRGTFVGLTTPTSISTILQQINIQPKIFNTLIDEININGQITSKQANGQYIPNIYIKRQTEWVHDFYKQNGFLEYDTLNKLGITNAKQYIQKQFPNDQLIYLKRCVINDKLIELTIIPALAATKQFIDLASLLPSSMEPDDRKSLFEIIINQKIDKNTIHNKFVLINDEMYTTVLTTDYLKELTKPCRDLANTKASWAVESGSYQQYIASKQLSHKAHNHSEIITKSDRKDEKVKKVTSSKAIGGGHGREIKMKSTKKQNRFYNKKYSNSCGDDDEEEHEVPDKQISKKPFELFTMLDLEEIFEKLTKPIDLDYLSNTLAAMYYEELNDLALSKAQELYEKNSQKSSAGSRQTHSAIQDKINTLLVDIRLYEKGIKLFLGSVQADLSKYLLKTLGNDVCNELMVYIAQECQIEMKTSNMNVDQRNKLAQECGHYKSSLLELNKTLSKTIEDFLQATELVMNQCSMIIKKADKKKDRLLILQHKQQLLDHLESITEPAIILHLTTLILFTSITGCILHASGKFVSQVLNFIKPSLNDEQWQLLFTYHDLVINILRVANDTEDYKKTMEALEDLQPSIKNLAANFTKPVPSKSKQSD